MPQHASGRMSLHAPLVGGNVGRSPERVHGARPQLHGAIIDGHHILSR